MTKLMQDRPSFCAHDGADPPETRDSILSGQWRSDVRISNLPAIWHAFRRDAAKIVIIIWLSKALFDTQK